MDNEKSLISPAPTAQPFAPPTASQSGRLPLVLLVSFLVAYTALLGWAWTRVTPSHEELYGAVGRFVDGFLGLFSRTGGIPWWTPDFLSGSSVAPLYMSILPILSAAGGIAIFGDPAGVKLAALLVIPFGGLSMWLFLRAFTGDAWIAAVGGMLYALSPQLLLRLANFEHWMGSMAYIFPPLILWAFLKVANEGSWRASVYLGAAWAAMMLCYAKLAFMFLPLAAIFVFWLLARHADERVRLLRGSALALVLVFLLAGVLLIPLVREYAWVTGFSLDPFADWQKAFSFKTLLSLFDRGGILMAGMPGTFLADRSQFYLGLLVLMAVAGALLVFRRDGAWWAGREGEALRLMLGLMLLSLWLAAGPYSPLLGFLEYLKGSLQTHAWAAPLSWFLLAIPAVLLWFIVPAGPRRGWWVALGLAVFYLVPGFRLLEQVPLFRDIRAPWGFWEVGFFSAAAAGAIALCAFLRRSIDGRDRLILAALLAVVAFLDASVYLTRFFQPGLPSELFDDFHAATRTLKDSEVPGRVYPVSGRYFYLRVPMESGRGLNMEASWSHFHLKWNRALLAAANSQPGLFPSYLNTAGISHILLDKQDPFTPPQAMAQLAQAYKPVFDSPHVAVLENPGSLAPAFLAREYVAVPPEAWDLAPLALELAGRLNMITVELPDAERAFPFLAGTASRETGAQLRPQYGDRPGQPFQRVPFALPRTNPMEIVFNPPEPRQGWLVITEAYHPDWKAFSGQAEVPVYRALGGLMAVPLAKTQGPVILLFSPPAWYDHVVVVAAGSWALVLGAMVLLPLPFMPQRLRDWWSGASRRVPEHPSETSIPRRVLVVIPTYNERESVGGAIDLVLAQRDYLEVLVVDDASPDDTASVVRSHPLFGRRVHLLEGTGKSGLGSAYRRGFRWGLERGYEVLVEMDADLSHDPADIPALLAALEDGADVAIGSRYLQGIRVLNWPQSRLFVSTFGGFYTRALTGLPLTDPTSGFKAIRARVLRGIPWGHIEAEGYAFQIELHFAAWRQGYSLREVPIVFNERRAGDSKMSTAISLEAAWKVLRLAARI